MSANRDKTQSFLFLYKSDKNVDPQDANEAAEPGGLNGPWALTRRVLKVEDQNSKNFQIQKYTPRVLGHSRVQMDIVELKRNLDSLEELQARLNFMLKELENLVKK